MPLVDKSTARGTFTGLLWSLCFLVALDSGHPSQAQNLEPLSQLEHLSGTTEHGRALLQSFLSRIPRCNKCKVRRGRRRGICRRRGRVWQCTRRRRPRRLLLYSPTPSSCPVYAVEEQPELEVLDEKCVELDQEIGQITKTIQWDLFIDKERDQIRDIIIKKASKHKPSYLWLAKDGGYLEETDSKDATKLKKKAENVKPPSDVGKYWYDKFSDPWVRNIFGRLLGPSVSDSVHPEGSSSPPSDRSGAGTTDTKLTVESSDKKKGGKDKRESHLGVTGGAQNKGPGSKPLVPVPPQKYQKDTASDASGDDLRKGKPSKTNAKRVKVKLEQAKQGHVKANKERDMHQPRKRYLRWKGRVRPGHKHTRVRRKRVRR